MSASGFSPIPTKYRYKLRFALLPVLATFDYGETPDIIWMQFYWKVEEVSVRTGSVWSTWNTKKKYS